jgi:deoxyribodipyrimidine photolyase-related protein
MAEIGLIYPHQLYRSHPVVDKNRKILLLEDSLFFYDQQAEIKFHKLKLVFHRATMKDYFHNYLAEYDAEYVDYKYLISSNDFKKILKKHQPQKIHIVDPTDDWLKKRIKKTAENLNIDVVWYPSPNFLTAVDELKNYFKDKKTYRHHYFYQWQRKRLNILVDKNNQPFGGKWSFDDQNRQPLPKDIDIPEISFVNKNNQYVVEAKKYVEDNFSDHHGDINWFGYPINHAQAEEWWQEFIKNRLANFGPYEDAISKNNPFLFHSLLSLLLNVGLLDPRQLVDDVLNENKKNDLPLNSCEGFLRQIIGWREFMRAVYLLIGRSQRKSNFLEQNKKLTVDWYNGKTGLTPLDQVIKRLNKYAYCHHIERLMILGNAMILSQIHPQEVYQWFMEMFIDAYDWVMVPNVYGMSQYADGGKIVTKPYVSGSNYIRKMSDYPNGRWSGIWDSLFWNFVNRHSNHLHQSARMGLMVNNWQKQSRQKKEDHLKIAKEFINQKTRSR